MSMPPPQLPPQLPKNGQPIGVIISAIAGIGCLSLAILGVIGTAMLGIFSVAPEDITVDLTFEERIAANKEFQITVRVQSTGSDSHKITSIDFPAEYVEGIAIETAEPPFVTKTGLGPLGESFDFDVAVEPGQAEEVVFTCFANKPGRYVGQVQVYVDDGLMPIEATIRSIVE